MDYGTDSQLLSPEISSRENELLKAISQLKDRPLIIQATMKQSNNIKGIVAHQPVFESTKVT